MPARGRALLLGLLVTPAVALSDVSYTIFRIVAATSTGLHGSVAYHATEEGWDPDGLTYTWALTDPIPIPDDITGEPIAYCLEGRLVATTQNLCSMQLDMGVLAGDVDTEFTITAPELSFRPIPSVLAEARATASFTVDDIDPNPDFAYIVGLGTPGTGAFRAYINHGSFRFSHLIGAVFASSGGTSTGSQFDPPVGFRPVGQLVESIRTEMAFRLTPNDVAFATTSFQLPEPAPCPGDVDSDADVDIDDLTVVLSEYGACAGDSNYDQYDDLDGDDCIAISDVAILLAAYGATCD